MKAIVSSALLFLFSLAFSYETLAYFSKKLSDDSFQTVLDDCESESDTESDDESEKKEQKEDLYFHESEGLAFQSFQNTTPTTDFLFFSSDYSLTIYSPPEQAVI